MQLRHSIQQLHEEIKQMQVKLGVQAQQLSVTTYTSAQDTAHLLQDRKQPSQD